MDTSCLVGCTPIHLEEEHVSKLKFLVTQISNETAKSMEEKNLEQFQRLVELYSDEPQLLDPALNELVTALVRHIRWPLPDEPSILDNSSIVALTYLRVLCLVRELRYSRNDLTTTTNSLSFAENIVCCLDEILRSETVDGALSVVPTLLAQILTRAPVNAKALEARYLNFQNVFDKFQSETDGGRQLINQLALANALLKWGRRRDIKPFTEQLFSSLSKDFLFSQCPNILVRHLISKLLQRISLVLLRPKLASWRYRCGYRSIEETLKRDKNLKMDDVSSLQDTRGHANEKEDSQNDDDDSDIPYDLIEIILGQLLLKLRDRDNLVRWTSAKGIARICARIPLEMAAQVVSSIFKDIFEDKTDSNVASSWMGGCLVLAELCCRGCLLPEQVPKAISLVLSRSLIFDSNQFGSVLALNIRDASCYICWAFARAYEAKFLRQHLKPLAGTLLSVALFDREVNVRRAASASFQENVGRNDSFPHGIPVLQLIDFGEIARIRHCYLEISVEVAKFPEYVQPMLDHLVELKCQHWDESIRELASEALQKLAPFDFEYSENELLPKLFKKLNSLDINEKHGAFFAVAGLLEALSVRRDQVLKKYSALLFEAINVNSLLLNDHRKKGFSLNAKSLCRIIRALCTIKCVLNVEQLNKFHNILDAVIGEENNQLSIYAQKAFPSLMGYYRGNNLDHLLNRMKNKYFPEIEKSNQTTESLCCCNIRPLAFLLPEFLDINFDYKEHKELLLLNIVIEKLIVVILDDDYTTTTNGNIGRFCRRAAIEGIGELLPLIINEEDKILILQEQLNLSIGKIIERACESIDDLRQKASNVLTKLITLIKDNNHPLQEENNKEFSNKDWLTSKGFERLSLLLNSTTYGNFALSGFVLSAGSVCAWTMENAFLAIVSYLKPHKKDIKVIKKIF
uniref:Tubulin-specific chaperone D n=1 Tax=Meloidogyne javanica TaxID=6303 RepID=A0A915LY91_MELJA